MSKFSQPKTWLVCILLAMTISASQTQAQTATPIDSIVALVDDDVVLRSELDLAIKGIVDRIRAQGGDLPPQHLLDKQVLERLIVRRLQLLRIMEQSTTTTNNGGHRN